MAKKQKPLEELPDPDKCTTVQECLQHIILLYRVFDKILSEFETLRQENN